MHSAEVRTNPEWICSVVVGSRSPVTAIADADEEMKTIAQRNRKEHSLAGFYLCTSNDDRGEKSSKIIIRNTTNTKQKRKKEKSVETKTSSSCLSSPIKRVLQSHNNDFELRYIEFSIAADAKQQQQQQQ